MFFSLPENARWRRAAGRFEAIERPALQATRKAGEFRIAAKVCQFAVL